MLIIFSELIIGVLIILFMATQIIMPYFRGTSFFPLFMKEAALQKELEEAKQKSVEADMINELKEIKESVKKKLEPTPVSKKKVNSKKV